MKNDELNKGLESLEEKVDVLITKANNTKKVIDDLDYQDSYNQENDIVMIRMNAAFDRLDASRARVERSLTGLYVLIVGTFILDLVSNLV
jgi:hypothetical protein